MRTIPVRAYAAAIVGLALVSWGAWLWVSLGFPLSWRSITDALALSRNTLDKDSPVFAISLGVLLIVYAAIEWHLKQRSDKKS